MFGVNYTMPFAYAYRVAGRIGADPYRAIDEDTYHFARLGLNAYRIHIWDVEITDHEGNLISNKHLDLLDYLISRLEQRGIHIILTTQSGWGNGYPERNIRTEGFGYDYDKGKINENPESIAIQKRYVTALVNHVNHYTGKAYKNDGMITGFEIGNEPVFSGTPGQILSYIDEMYETFRKAGCDKLIFNNISQNPSIADVFLKSKVEGITCQWYPTGLVAGHTRHGNFLPCVDSYDFPFDTIPGFGKKKRIVYEFDAADLMYSYMYPAIARTFRTAGFFWITQFAYDPMILARYNTEYQTHFLNLAYTPSKAISLKIAGEVARRVRSGESFGKYPSDTLFGDFKVSYYRDMSELNSGTEYYYSGCTSDFPKNITALSSIAGVGSSPIVNYEGTGAYFLDKLSKGVWRLEVMPDAVRFEDPFSTPSLKRTVTEILWHKWPMTISLPDLDGTFEVKPLNKGNDYRTVSEKGTVEIFPGAYLLVASGAGKRAASCTASSRYGNISLGEFEAPAQSIVKFRLRNSSLSNTEKGKDIDIKAVIAGPSEPDSVVVYPSYVSFWNDRNPRFVMKRTEGYSYETVIPAASAGYSGEYDYYISVFHGNEKRTFPGDREGLPFDWDFIRDSHYSVTLTALDSPVKLIYAYGDRDVLEVLSGRGYGIEVRIIPEESEPSGKNIVRYECSPLGNPDMFFLRKYVGKELAGLSSIIAGKKDLCVGIGTPSGLDSLDISIITKAGYTYSASIKLPGHVSTVRMPLSSLKGSPTRFVPAQYPSFLHKEFVPDSYPPLDISKADIVMLSTHGKVSQPFSFDLSGVWLE
jgi:hypothetical protein